MAVLLVDSHIAEPVKRFTLLEDGHPYQAIPIKGTVDVIIRFT